MDPYLIRHLKGQTENRFPVWMMRQAGRYLPQYMKLREKYSFWERVTQPELATKISLQPLEEVPVDAVIFFSDILTLPHSLKIPIDLVESQGPTLKTPLRSLRDFAAFERFIPEEHVPYVGKTLHNIRMDLNPEKALIGFAGAPWTVCCYLIEGKGSKDFTHAKKWLQENPKTLIHAMNYVAGATIKYLQYQIDSGAQIIQLFDTWAQYLPQPFFESTYVDILNSILSPIKDRGTPCIYFAKDKRFSRKVLEKLNLDILSVGSEFLLSEWQEAIPSHVKLQGNFPPELLEAGPIDRIKTETQALINDARALKQPAIINLGHGVSKNTPLDHVKCFVNEAKAAWK